MALPPEAAPFDLQAAINAAGDGEPTVIELNSDIILNGYDKIPQDKIIKLQAPSEQKSPIQLMPTGFSGTQRFVPSGALFGNIIITEALNRQGQCIGFGGALVMNNNAAITGNQASGAGAEYSSGTAVHSA